MARLVRLRSEKKRGHSRILEKRDPALITLPIPIPSIPIVAPILTPLIAGAPAPAKPTTTPQIPVASTPQPAATSDPSPTPTPQPQNPSPANTPPTPSPVGYTSAPSPTPALASAPAPAPSPAPSPSLAPAPAPAPAPASVSVSAPSPPSQSSPSSNSPPSGSNNNFRSGNNGNSGGGSDQNNNSGSGNGQTNNSGGGSGQNNNSGGGSSPTNNGGSVTNSQNGGSGTSTSGQSGNGGSSPSTLTQISPVGLSLSSGTQQPGVAGGTNTPIGTASPTTGASSLSGLDPTTATFRGVVNVGPSPSAGVAYSDATPSLTYSAVGSHGTSHSGSSGGGSSGPGSSSPGTSGGGGGGGGGGSGNNDDPNTGSGAAPGHHHGLSPAIIAILAVLGGILLILLILFLCRRHSLHKRLTRRKQWFARRSVYETMPISSSGYFREHPSTTQSSFSFEHVSMPQALPPVPLSSDWPLPPPQQMRQSNTFVVTLPPAAPTTPSSCSPTIRNIPHDVIEPNVDQVFTLAARRNRESAGLQPILVPDRALVLSGPVSPSMGTPMSVRPFSPSDRWSFPKPPTASSDRLQSEPIPEHETERSGLSHSVSSFECSLSEYATARGDSMDNDPENPFADFTSGSSEDAHTSETFVTVDSDTITHFRAVERVCRPFIPIREDEMAVSFGDEVRVLRRYDDGWAYGESFRTGERGLFPIDCLRMPDQDLAAFLSERSLSSYADV